MDNIIFANKELLWLLLILIPLTARYFFKKRKSQATLQVSSLESFKQKGLTYKRYFRHILFLLRTATIALLIIILARPQEIGNTEDRISEGIDIVIALDISSSMLAKDFEPDRLEASKNIAMQFISGREFDRIGLVLFSGEAFTQCPLTTDYAVLLNLFEEIKTGMIEDGTAIGNGLLNAVNRLKESQAESKVIILLTDGVNNRGEADPVTAAEIAQQYAIRIYTVGVGKTGTAPYPVQTPFGLKYRPMEVKIDEENLQSIADITGGEYFRATDNQKLKAIYKQIDALEKSKIETRQYQKKTEIYMPLALLAGLLIFIEVLLRFTVFRNIP